MKRLIITLLFCGFASSCVTKTSTRSTLSTDLVYVISPVSENDTDYVGTVKETKNKLKRAISFYVI
jgi:hypothetical protein